MNTTNELLTLLLSLAGGTAVGVLYFGGLWRTVQALTASPRPTLLFVGSFVLRNAVLAAGAVGLALLADWYHLAVFLLAVIGVRIVLVRRQASAARNPQ